MSGDLRKGTLNPERRRTETKERVIHTVHPVGRRLLSVVTLCYVIVKSACVP